MNSIHKSVQSQEELYFDENDGDEWDRASLFYDVSMCVELLNAAEFIVLLLYYVFKFHESI